MLGRMSTIITVFILIAFGPGLAQEPAGRKIYPADESHLDPSFAEFKANLLKAIETQDREFLLSALAPEVRLSFDAPIPADRAMASFDRNEGASWKVLHKLLLMGVKRLEDGRFLAPYVWYVIARERPKGFHDITNMVIIDKDVELYAEPKSNASVVALLSYDIVEFHRNETFPKEMVDGERWSWEKITTIPDGQTGYIRNKYGYTVDNVRASFAKHEGEWKLVFMVTGL